MFRKNVRQILLAEKLHIKEQVGAICHGNLRFRCIRPSRKCFNSSRKYREQRKNEKQKELELVSEHIHTGTRHTWLLAILQLMSERLAHCLFGKSTQNAETVQWSNLGGWHEAKISLAYGFNTHFISWENQASLSAKKIYTWLQFQLKQRQKS